MVMYSLQRWKPHWDMERLFNAPLFFYGITFFPRYEMTSFFSAFIVSVIL